MTGLAVGLKRSSVRVSELRVSGVGGGIQGFRRRMQPGSGGVILLMQESVKIPLSMQACPNPIWPLSSLIGIIHCSSMLLTLMA